MVAVPKGRASADIEVTPVDEKLMNMPERIVALEAAVERLDVAALLDCGFAFADCYVFEP